MTEKMTGEPGRSEAEDAFPLHWKSLGSGEFLRWAKLHTDKNISGVSVSSGGADRAKADLTGTGNILREGEVIRLPSGFKYDFSVPFGANQEYRANYTLAVEAPSGYADFEVTGVDYDSFGLFTHDPGVKLLGGDPRFGYHAGFSMPKYLVNAEHPDEPIPWRELVISSPPEEVEQPRKQHFPPAPRAEMTAAVAKIENLPPGQREPVAKRFLRWLKERK